METIHLTYPLHIEREVPPVSLAIGYFDGVHLGHRSVIERARQIAGELGVSPAVMTFHPHPREVLGKASVSRYLTPLREKLLRFEELGVQRVYVMKFDRELASRTREEFIEEVLIPLKVRGVTVGFNFTFGRGAAGKAEDLNRLSDGRFQVEIVHPIASDGDFVSSTRLRQTLDEGDVEAAMKILGRPYSLRGEVVQGDQRGRTIGFPTANIRLEEPFIIPATGVYVVRVRREGVSKDLFGMMNIGYRPTFRDPDPVKTLEVHLFDLDENLYGDRLEVEFLHRLRGEQPFASVTALTEQLKSDERNSRAWLNRRNLC
ncbi:bifunctional riboflavin kinase/FAD synthetase [Kroppenstedtia eburnea]|uniref:bifunctional riboflavin kinase/FAD synthetase n=1 Tax=Kroppenstedtia eburnea TaxID=714067 RepID=UPI0036332C45